MKTHISKLNIVAWICLAALSAYAYCLEQATVSCMPEGLPCLAQCGPHCTVTFHNGSAGPSSTPKDYTFYADEGFWLESSYELTCNYTCQIARCFDGAPMSVQESFSATGYRLDQNSYCGGD